MAGSQYKTVRLILGDQLNHSHSWFQHNADDVIYVMAELLQEAEYVSHHIQKHCAFFASMQAFADTLAGEGHHIEYIDLDASVDFPDLSTLIESFCHRVGAEVFEYQRPDEYRLVEQLSALHIPGVVINRVDTEHFMLGFDEIPRQFTSGKHVLMENFYRRMRKQFNILMEEDGSPAGGKWNFDAQNRNKLKPADLQELPSPLIFSNDVSQIQARLERHHVENIGSIEGDLVWPINRAQSLALMEYFCEACLADFGTYQDAMTAQHQSKWSLYHSRLSFSLNTKMLSPEEVVTTVIKHYEASDGKISLAQVEGFVRQIIGWREYVRAIYWVNMPGYAALNYFEAKRKLPEYFWTAETDMACMQQAISQSLEYGYAHHIQRLMVVGNFALLTELDPTEVDAWYLGIYVDAIEWVEMPNTRGMALFADGGIMATKPYAASGAYINRMSDYCKSCAYKVSQRTGSSACPLNSLYWRFMTRHRETLQNNRRVRMIYGTWDKMDPMDQEAILSTAEMNLNRLNKL